MKSLIINTSNFHEFSYIVPYIRHCHEDKYNSKWILEKRKIIDYELIYITKGKGQFIIDDKQYTVQENDLLLLKPKKYHCAASIIHPFQFMCLHFDLFISRQINLIDHSGYRIHESIPAKPVKYYKAVIDYPEYAKISDHDYFKLLFNQIISEKIGRKPGYIIVMKALFNELLFYLFRKTENNDLKVTVPPEIESIIDFIKSNYMRRIYLSDISRHIHLQSTYVSSLFKKHTGFTITSFINNYRIAKAKELLLNTSNKVSDIAYETGFFDSHHLTRLFKEHEGMTPGQYRELGLKANCN